MHPNTFHPLPTADPVTNEPLYVSELKNDETGISIRGRFMLPAYARLNEEQSKFLETFLRCRGVLSSVERELGVSYPTVRLRLDALLDALGLAPVKEREERRDKRDTERGKVLDELERGEISADEAKARLRGGER